MTLKRVRSLLASFLSMTACVAAFSLAEVRAQDAIGTEQPPQLLDQSITTENFEGDIECGTSYSFSDAGGCQPWAYGNPALFYNFYGANNCGGFSTQLYTAPLPVPAHVGHTYYTYQPLMPHEFMYPHHRTYRRYYDGGRGLNRTKVEWYCNPLTVALKGIAHAIEIPR